MGRGFSRFILPSPPQCGPLRQFGFLPFYPFRLSNLVLVCGEVGFLPRHDARTRTECLLKIWMTPAEMRPCVEREKHKEGVENRAYERDPRETRHYRDKLHEQI